MGETNQSIQLPFIESVIQHVAPHHVSGQYWIRSATEHGCRQQSSATCLLILSFKNIAALFPRTFDKFSTGRSLIGTVPVQIWNISVDRDLLHMSCIMELSVKDSPCMESSKNRVHIIQRNFTLEDIFVDDSGDWRGVTEASVYSNVHLVPQ